MCDRTKEQILEELAATQKTPGEGTETQAHMIKKIQSLITNEGLYSQIIDLFPYPIAIYTDNYKLSMTNRAFSSETKTHVEYPGKGNVHILLLRIDDMQLAAAVKGVFAGKTYFLEGIRNPFSMFSGITQQNMPEPDRFTRIVIFPVPANDDTISHGVILFLP